MRRSGVLPFFIFLAVVALGCVGLFCFVELDVDGDERVVEDFSETTVSDAQEEPAVQENPAPPVRNVQKAPLGKPVDSGGQLEEILAAAVTRRPKTTSAVVPEPEPVVPDPYDGWSRSDHASERQRARENARSKLEAILNED